VSDPVGGPVGSGAGEVVVGTRLVVPVDGRDVVGVAGTVGADPPDDGVRDGSVGGAEVLGAVDELDGLVSRLGDPGVESDGAGRTRK
jgi:hypothetical protein